MKFKINSEGATFVHFVYTDLSEESPVHKVHSARSKCATRQSSKRPLVTPSVKLSFPQPPFLILCFSSKSLPNLNDYPAIRQKESKIK